MNLQDFEFLRNFVKERSGLVLSADKQYLIESRLAPVARNAGLADLSDLARKLRQPNVPRGLDVDVVEAMLTNETLFFRDKIPFDQFRAVIVPALLAARAHERCIRIWCAAASTGQEPYSFAMCLKELATELVGWKIEIVATDLSREVLEKAKSGVYSQFEVQRGLPIQMLVKYFSKAGDAWQISPELRAMVQFRSFNLLNDFSGFGTFDIVFCRNVLIYFDQATKIDVLDRMTRAVASDGYLVLGAAETVIGLNDNFKPVLDQHGLYAPSADRRNATARRLTAVGGAL